MDSSDFYNVKQQFTLGAYKTVADLTLPDENSPEYSKFLLYKIRATLALGRSSDVENLVPKNTEEPSLKAISALARYLSAQASGASRDEILEELRDLCVEVEGDDVEEGDRGLVKVFAGTAFAREGEIEEGLETLGAGGSSENLEATALIVQIYLSIDRPDLAKKEYERALKWAEDDLLLQSIEASIGLVTGADGYSNSFSYYSEQLGNPSLSSPHLLTSRAVTRLLRGEVAEAKSDLEEALHAGEDEETLMASVVAAGLQPTKKGEADELFAELAKKFPSCPMVKDVTEKSSLFDSCITNFTIPPPAIAGRA
ncbi:hypothetical protein SCHPADRAFT_834954 [Schizopora paradoxa]|uniref:Coatomer subunit epsilon n=1 Tax=Schizopora paradoxa TaxID=27342 RepID=A0A0H2RA40_9AGAM|nr:hypothetical protein SCHPADRAFT_834954 [Schizopora paradoxa]